MIDGEIDDEEVLAALEALSEKIGGREALGTVANAIAEEIRLGFEDSTDPWGTPWKALKFRAGQPLKDTGVLANSITHNITSDTSAEVGTNICYAIVHQFGATVKADQPKGKQSLCGYVTKGAKRLAFSAGGSIIHAKSVTIPARPFMPIRNGAADLPESWKGSILAALSGELGLDSAT